MTPIVVQKYGGSVLVNEAAYERAARHVKHTVKQGRRVVAVVSALKGQTDELLNRSKRVNPEPVPEAVDLLLASGELQSAALLAMALRKLGVNAEALNPWQLGVHTDSSHGDARITRINPLPLKVKLSELSAVIAPGFIGRAKDGGLTTLGRGGSDLSAVAFADALNAEACEFFKDVPGYFSADPRLVPNAIHRPYVTEKEAMELSEFGCRFLQDRAIQWAVQSQCRVLLRALGEDERATALLRSQPKDHPPVLALTHCETPGEYVSKLPESLGKDTSLLSFVGSRINEEKIFDSLSKEKVDFHLMDSTPDRVTVAINAYSLIKAQQVAHDGVMG